MQEQNENARAEMEEKGESERARERIVADMTMNDADNRTALTIAAAEIESGEKTNRTTGGDSSPGS
jgi:hypothetical protein